MQMMGATPTWLLTVGLTCCATVSLSACGTDATPTAAQAAADGQATATTASEASTPIDAPYSLALLDRAERAMSALDTYDQHVYAAEQSRDLSDDGHLLWELWDVEYRHEKPDRLRMVVRTAWLTEDDVHRRPGVGIHIGERTWTRDLPAGEHAPWACTGSGTTEMPGFILMPSEGEAAEYVGLETIGDQAHHVVRVLRPDGGVGAAREDEMAHEAVWEPVGNETRYWIEPETYRVVRIETDRFDDGRMASTEVRTYSAFNSPAEIAPPGPCDLSTPVLEIEEAHDPVLLAMDGLLQLHRDLYERRYEGAAELYGGTYDGVRDWNPTVDRDDHAALLRAACTYQLRCMAVHRVSSSGEEVAPGEYAFTVEYKTPDGELFELGPCCGANATDMPPRSQFECRVKVVGENTVKVMCLPPYVP